MSTPAPIDNLVARLLKNSMDHAGKPNRRVAEGEARTICRTNTRLGNKLAAEAMAYMVQVMIDTTTVIGYVEYDPDDNLFLALLFVRGDDGLYEARAFGMRPVRVSIDQFQADLAALTGTD